jgi:hypothetical protein
MHPLGPPPPSTVIAAVIAAVVAAVVTAVLAAAVVAPIAAILVARRFAPPIEVAVAVVPLAPLIPGGTNVPRQGARVERIFPSSSRTVQGVII